jgi:hypothetical protein
MMLRVDGLEQRPKGSVWKYRRAIPPRLRELFGGRHQVIRSLGTKDKLVALRRLPAVAAEVDRTFREAEQAIKNPTVAAYKAVEEWRQWTAGRLVDDDHEDAVDMALTTALERDAAGEKPLGRMERATVEALLKRHESGGEDNPPLSILADRYYAEKKLPVQTQQEWRRVIRLIHGEHRR